MFKLMKYELYRRKTLLTSVLVIIAFLEAAVCFGIYKGGNWSILSVIFTFVILIGGLLFPFIDTIVNYYSDFKNKHGYMLFLTPNSGIKIIGSKALFAFIELILMVGLLIGVFSISHALLDSVYPTVINRIFGDMFSELKTMLDVDKLSIWTATPIILVTILQYFNNIMIAVLALTLSKTVLSNNNFNWLYALLIYIGLSIGIQTVNTSILLVFGFASDMIQYVNTGQSLLTEMMKYLYVGSGIYVFWIGVSLVVSSLLLTKRTDL